MKQNYKMTIMYDGTKYNGWEKQKNTDITIQGKIEAVLFRMVNESVELIAAGRTDAGVHAKAMIANAFLTTDMTTDEIKSYLNRYLPEDIVIIDVKEAAERFHSRYNAVGKTYIYTCYDGDEKPVFDRKYVYILDRKPDINKMKKAAEYMLGKHDFASFCSNSKIKKSTVREVDEISIIRNGDYIKFIFHGNGFLYNMVRILTGTLLEVGYGKRTPESIAELFEVKNRSLAGFTAPAQGLCLEKVDYN